MNLKRITITFTIMVLMSCSTIHNTKKMSSNYIVRIDNAFKNAYEMFEIGDYSHSKQHFLKYHKLDTLAIHYESYSFLAESYKQLGLIDSGYVVYQNGVELIKSKSKSEEKIKELTSWQNIFPDFPNELRKENGFVPYNTHPEPIGGFSQIQRQVEYPFTAQTMGIQGTVLVLALIDENGNPVKFEIKRSLNKNCDQAAIDAIAKTKFIPGKMKGRPKKIWIALPINFRLK